MCEECWNCCIDFQKNLLFSTIQDNLKLFKDFRPHTTNFGKYFKEFVVHHALYDSFVLLVINIYHIFQIISSDPSNARTVNAVLQLVLSCIYLSYAIFDKLHHCNHQVSNVHGGAEETNSTKRRNKYVDLVRMFLFDIIFYVRLLLILLVFGEESTQDDISLVTWLNFFITIKSKILYSYITPAVVVGEKAWSKLTKGDKKLFHLCSFIKVYGQKGIQLMLLLAIGLRYHTEYVNGYNKEYEAHINQSFQYNFRPSGQLWYMMFSGYLAPILGLIMFVMLLLQIHNVKDDIREDLKDRVIRLIYLLISPWYMIPCVLYSIALAAFGLCTVINIGVGGAWITLYVLGPLFALAVNVPAPVLWVLRGPKQVPMNQEATDQGILMKEIADDEREGEVANDEREEEATDQEILTEETA